MPSSSHTLAIKQSRPHEERVLFVDDFAPYRDDACNRLSVSIPSLSISAEGDFKNAITRIKNERPKILILDLHGPNGAAEGLEVLQEIIKSRVPPMKIIINSGEHASEIRDAFARSLQLLGPKGQRILDSVAIVVIAKGQDDLVQACENIQSLCLPKRVSISRLDQAIAQTLAQYKKYDRANDFLAAELEQYAQVWTDRCRKLAQNLDAHTHDSSIKKISAYLKMNTPRDQDLANNSFVREFAIDNSLRTSRHFYDNLTRWVRGALVYQDFQTVLSPYPELVKEFKNLLDLTEEFQDKMASSRHKAGISKYLLKSFYRDSLGDVLSNYISCNGLDSLESTTNIQTSVSLGRALTELVCNSFKAYGVINENKIDASMLSEKTKVEVSVARLTEDQFSALSNKLSNLKLEAGEIVLKVIISDQAGGLKIPLEQALQEGESTFGTAGMGMAEVCGILDRNRCYYEFNTSSTGFSTTIYMPARVFDK